MSDVLDLFLRLVTIPSGSGNERVMADHVRSLMHILTFAVYEDDKAEDARSNAGNIYGRMPPNGIGEPLLFCAHLDTVQRPNDVIEPIVENGVVRNARSAILGADNKAAIAAMITGIKRHMEAYKPQGGIEVLFTVNEEVGLYGAKVFDTSVLDATVGYTFDQAGPIGEIVTESPGAQQIDFTFRGKSAHAGMFPEEGRSAIVAASRAISEMSLGKLDEDTTANVGIIRGGTATNIVPDLCFVQAEVRSHDEAKLAQAVQSMQDAATFAAGVAECEVETQIRRQYEGYRFTGEEHPVRIAADALEKTGHEVKFIRSGGASDANALNARGLTMVNLSNGMRDIHTPQESISVDDLEAMVKVVLQLLQSTQTVDY